MREALILQESGCRFIRLVLRTDGSCKGLEHATGITVVLETLHLHPTACMVVQEQVKKKLPS
jgi:hypothetical protein